MKMRSLTCFCENVDFSIFFKFSASNSKFHIFVVISFLFCINGCNKIIIFKMLEVDESLGEDQEVEEAEEVEVFRKNFFKKIGIFAKIG
jgi:hypothetical protein